MMEFLKSNFWPTIAGLALIYTPFLWCKYRKEDPRDYGLCWVFTKKSLLECLILTSFILLCLTVVALNWRWESLPRHNSFMRALSLGGTGVAAAIIEEIFYRGWLQPLFRKRFNAFFSIVFTSAIFAASHVFVADTIFLFAVFFPGCIMGFLRERHGNIATSTLFHGISNLWSVWFAPLKWPSIAWVMNTLASITFW